MTTTVKVTAHCNPASTEVRVLVSGQPDQVLQDGDETEVHAFDDRVILVQEVSKVAAEPGENS